MLWGSERIVSLAAPHPHHREKDPGKMTTSQKAMNAFFAVHRLDCKRLRQGGDDSTLRADAPAFTPAEALWVPPGLVFGAPTPPPPPLTSLAVRNQVEPEA